MAIYEGAQTVVRKTGDSKTFSVKVVLHQTFVLSPLLFVIAGVPAVLKFLKFQSCPEIVLNFEIVLKF